jgi:hypothetical protein
LAREGKVVTGILSVAAGIAHLTEFVSKNHGSGYTWAVLVDTGNGLEVHERYSHPCYGEMRPYAQPKVDHKDAKKDYWEPELLPIEQRAVKKPTDLFWPFPKGEPIALGVTNYNKSDSDAYNDMMEHIVYNPEISPWRQCLADTTIVKNGKLVAGIVFNSTDFDPTIAVNMFRKTANNLVSVAANMKTWLKCGATEQEAFILAGGMIVDDYVSYNSEEYAPFGVTPDFSKLINGEANDLTGGGTFRQRYAYNRPKNDYVFKGENFTHLVGAKLGKKGDYITFTKAEIPVILSTLRSLVKDKQVKAA